jgi:hypothetical protein
MLEGLLIKDGKIGAVCFKLFQEPHIHVDGKSVSMDGWKELTAGTKIKIIRVVRDGGDQENVGLIYEYSRDRYLNCLTEDRFSLPRTHLEFYEYVLVRLAEKKRIIELAEDEYVTCELPFGEYHFSGPTKIIVGKIKKD